MAPFDDLVFQAVEDDLTTVILDLNTLGNDGSLARGFGLRHLMLGRAQTEATWIMAPPEAGADQATAFDPESTGRLTLFAQGNDYDDLEDLIQELADVLSNPRGPFRYGPQGADEYRYIDFDRSPTSGLYLDRQSSYIEVVKQFLAVELTVDFFHHPYPRLGTQTIANDVAITNAAGDNAVIVSNPDANAESEVRLTLTVPDADDIVQVIMGRRTAREADGSDLVEFVDDFSSGAFTAAVQPTTHMTRLWRGVLTPSNPKSLEGTFRFLANLRLDDAEEYDFQVRWALTDLSPAGKTGEVWPFDMTEVPGTPAQYSDHDLGLVTFDETGDALVLELWGKATGGGQITYGHWVLLPADESDGRVIVLSAPGQRLGLFGKDRWMAEDLVLGGNAGYSNGRVLLDENGDYTTQPPETGQALPAGQHSVMFRGQVQRNNAQKAKAGQSIVLRAGSEIQRQNVYTGDGQVWVGLAQSQVRFTVSGADEGLGTLFSFQLEREGVGSLHVYYVDHWWIPTVTDGGKMIADSGRRVAYIASAAGLQRFPLQAAGGLPKIRGGSTALIFRLGSITQAGMQNVDQRGPLPAAGDALGALVKVEVVPRLKW